MKKNLAIISFSAFLLLTTPVLSQEEEGGMETNFSNMKSEILGSLNEEKSILEQTIACINSAQDQESMKKCHEIKRSGMEKMQQKNRQRRREHLQNELKKLDEKDVKVSGKGKF